VEPQQETVIYRDEVLAMIGAMADLVVEVRHIRRLLEKGDEQEEEEE
jgi:hypothetical protein